MLKAVNLNFMICCIKFLGCERNDSPAYSVVTVDTVPRIIPAPWKNKLEYRSYKHKILWAHHENSCLEVMGAWMFSVYQQNFRMCEKEYALQ